MGLYLAVFDGATEVEGVEVGHYSDFGYLRECAARLEPREGSSVFPTLMNHSDCDGEWTPDEAMLLEKELSLIDEAFHRLPPEPLKAGWKETVAREHSIRPNNLYECFFDVDGEPLIARLIELSQLSQKLDLPILFQ